MIIYRVSKATERLVVAKVGMSYMNDMYVRYLSVAQLR